jgi:hypothetical protein
MCSTSSATEHELSQLRRTSDPSQPPSCSFSTIHLTQNVVLQQIEYADASGSPWPRLFMRICTRRFVWLCMCDTLNMLCRELCKKFNRTWRTYAWDNLNFWFEDRPSKHHCRDLFGKGFHSQHAFVAYPEHLPPQTPTSLSVKMCPTFRPWACIPQRSLGLCAGGHFTFPRYRRFSLTTAWPLLQRRHPSAVPGPPTSTAIAGTRYRSLDVECWPWGFRVSVAFRAIPPHRPSISGA